MATSSSTAAESANRRTRALGTTHDLSSDPTGYVRYDPRAAAAAGLALSSARWARAAAACWRSASAWSRSCVARRSSSCARGRSPCRSAIAARRRAAASCVRAARSCISIALRSAATARSKAALARCHVAGNSCGTPAIMAAAGRFTRPAAAAPGRGAPAVAGISPSDPVGNPASANAMGPSVRRGGRTRCACRDRR